MTSLDDRYRLLKCVALGGGIRTHNAQEIATGRPVMVHILDGAEPEAVERLREQVGALGPADRSRIVDMAATADGFMIVSEFLAGLTTFPEWLGGRAATPAPPAEDSVPEPVGPATKTPTESFVIGRIESSRSAPPAGVQPPGEFTRLFQGAGDAAGASASPSPPAPPPPRPQQPTAPQPADAVAPPAPRVAPPSPAAAAAPQVPRPTPVPAAPSVQPPPPREPSLQPGEFTSLFRPAAAPSPREVASSPLVRGAASPTASPLGQPLGTPLGAAPPPPPPPFPASSSSAFAAPPPAAPDAGRAFGSLGMPAAPPPVAPSPFGAPPPAPPPSPSPFAPPPLTPPLPSVPPASPLAVPPSPLTAPAPGHTPLPPVLPPPVFGASRTAGFAGSPGGPSSPLADQRGGGPSDYTKLIRQAATPAPPAPAPAPAPVAPAAPPRRPLPLGLIIALNVVLVLAIALVLYFVLRPAPPNANPGTPVPGGTPPAVAAPAVTPPAIPAAPAAKP